MGANTINSLEQTDSNQIFANDPYAISEPSQFNWLFILIIGVSIFFGFLILARSILYYNKGLKSQPLGKIQIIVKAVITIIGINLLLRILQQLQLSGSIVLSQFSLISKMYAICYFLIVIGLIITIFYFFVHNNEWLVIKIAKPKEYISGQNELLWFISSFRIAFVFFGLSLFAFSADSIVSTVLLIITLPMQCRSFITRFVETGRLVEFSIVNLPQWFRTTYHLLITFLTIYFTCGAKHFLNWQLKRRLITSKPNQPERDNNE